MVSYKLYSSVLPSPCCPRLWNGRKLLVLMVDLKREQICKHSYRNTKHNSLYTQRGPLISPAAKQRVTSLIASVEEEGGRIHLDGRNIVVPGYPNGNFVGPTVVEATVDMRAYKSVSLIP